MALNCPPCHHNCDQGTDCPARRPMPSPETASWWAAFAEFAVVAFVAGCLVMAALSFLAP